VGGVGLRSVWVGGWVWGCRTQMCTCTLLQLSCVDTRSELEPSWSCSLRICRLGPGVQVGGAGLCVLA